MTDNTENKTEESPEDSPPSSADKVSEMKEAGTAGDGTKVDGTAESAGHTHTMTLEYYEDMEALKDAAAFLLNYKKPIEDFVSKAKECATCAEQAISTVREEIHPKKPREDRTPSHQSLGLWAAGMGNFALSKEHKLKEKIDNSSLVKAGQAVEKFFTHLKADDGKGRNLLASLIEAAIAEDKGQTDPAKKIPRHARLRLEVLYEKINKRLEQKEEKLRGVPPYLWPSTYVSSSSSTGYSSSSWPPPPA